MVAPNRESTQPETLRPVVPEAAEWEICPGCRQTAYGRRLADNLRVCPDCGNHLRLTAPERLAQLLDEGSIELLDAVVRLDAPLAFVDSKPYPDRWQAARRATGLAEAVQVARGRIDGNPVIAAGMDFRFLGGSLGAAAGELITLAAAGALRERTPLPMGTPSRGPRV